MSLILPYKGINPEISERVFIAPNATVIGDVKIGKDSSIWFGAVLRGDVNYIRIGENTNIQDLSAVHVTGITAPTIIGNFVTIGHNAIIHGGEIGNYCLIGMGAIILDNVVMEDYSMVAAGALITPKTVIKKGMLYAGVPGKPIRPLRESELKHLEVSAQNYTHHKNDYLK